MIKLMKVMSSNLESLKFADCSCRAHDERAGRRASYIFTLRILVAAAMLLLALLAARAESTTAHSKLAGVYESEGTKTGPHISVSLGKDGSATITEDCGEGTTTLFGRWVDSGSQVTVKLDAADGQPAKPMIFEPSHDGLQAVTWDHAVWGKLTPPAMKKGGYKVKEMYWLTTVR